MIETFIRVGGGGSYLRFLFLKNVVVVDVVIVVVVVLHFCSMASLKKAASIKILPGKGNGFPS
jgi:hypothetical protein